MKRIAALALGTAAVIAAPAAFAGGPVVPVAEPIVAAPAPVIIAPVTGDWNGGYVGAQLGYADGGSADGDGALGGIHGGYRWDLGRTVLGVEGMYNSADLSGEGDLITLDNLASITGQVGREVGKTLVYAKAGVAYADGEIVGENADDYGYTVGLGVDYQVNQNWTVGGEVSTYSFDDFDDSGVKYNPTAVQLKAAYNF